MALWQGMKTLSLECRVYAGVYSQLTSSNSPVVLCYGVHKEPWNDIVCSAQLVVGVLY
jgi:hypothetical protein